MDDRARILRILITNDDGVDADGLDALVAVMKQEHDVTIVAPSGPRSECSHTVETRRPLRVHRMAENTYAVDGFPADCVRLAMRAIFQDQGGPKFDWVFSGINQGGNLGIDRYLSGTVAAAREAAVFGMPAIAFSHFIRREMPLDWPQAASWAMAVWNQLKPGPPPPGYFWSVNFPHLPSGSPCPDIVTCVADNLPLDVQYTRTAPDTWQYSGSYPDRPASPERDTAVCFGGRIAQTLLSL